MARYLAHRDTKPISTFVPLPLDYLRKSLEAEQSKFDTVRSNVIAADLTGINYIPYADKDKKLAEQYQNTKKELVEEASMAIDPSNIDRKNWRNQIDIATNKILELKRLEKMKTIPGTIPYEIQANYDSYIQDMENIRKIDYMSNSEKLGAYEQQKNRYLNEGQVLNDNNDINKYFKFSEFADYDFDKFRQSMKDITIDKFGSTITDYKLSNLWNSTTHIETEKRPYSKLLVAGSSLMTGNNQLIERLKRKIELEYYDIAKNQGTDFAKEWIDRELDALSGGGFSNSALNMYYSELDKMNEKDKKEYIKKHPYNPVDFLARGTIAGDLLNGGAMALIVDNEKTTKSISGNRYINPSTLRTYYNPSVVTQGEGKSAEYQFDPTIFRENIKNLKESGALLNSFIDVTDQSSSYIGSLFKDIGKEDEFYNKVYEMDKEGWNKKLNELDANFEYVDNKELMKRVISLSLTTGDLSGIKGGDFARSSGFYRGMTRISTKSFSPIGIPKSIIDAANDEYRLNDVIHEYFTETPFKNTDETVLVAKGNNIVYLNESPNAKETNGLIRKQVEKGQIVVNNADAETKRKLEFSGISFFEGEPKITFRVPYTTKNAYGYSSINYNNYYGTPDNHIIKQMLFSAGLDLFNSNNNGNLVEVQKVDNNRARYKMQGSIAIEDNFFNKGTIVNARVGDIITVSPKESSGFKPMQVEVTGFEDKSPLYNIIGEDDKGNNVLYGNPNNNGDAFVGSNGLLEAYGLYTDEQFILLYNE